MAFPVNQEMVDQALTEHIKTAEEILKDKEKTEKTLIKLEAEFASIPVAGDWLSQIPVLIEFCRAYAEGEYTEPPMGTMVGIVATLLYCITPFDIIPDALGPVGFVDDMAAMVFLNSKINKDVEAFKNWQKEQGLRE